MQGFKQVIYCCLLLAAWSCDANPLYKLSVQPPSGVPQVFKLPTPDGFVATERLAFKNDYTEIYYSLVNGYQLDSDSSIQKLVYSDGQWQPPVTAVKGFNSPALSIDGQTLFIEGKNDKDVWFLTKNKQGWGNPKKRYNSAKERHYFSQLNSGNYYYSSPVAGEASLRDFFVLEKGNSKAIGEAINLAEKSDFPRDFFIARDGSYLITRAALQGAAAAPDIAIYFKQSNGKWSAPQSLGSKINATLGAWKWGFYVTDDHNYFFFTSGNEINDTKIYWSRFAQLLLQLQAKGKKGN